MELVWRVRKGCLTFSCSLNEKANIFGVNSKKSKRKIHKNFCDSSTALPELEISGLQKDEKKLSLDKKKEKKIDERKREFVMRDLSR